MAEQHSHHTQETAGTQVERRKKHRNRRSHRILFGIGTFFLIFAITCSFLACFAAVYIKNIILPQSELDVAEFPMNLSSTIYYTDPLTGVVSEYETLHGDQNRIWVPYSEIPEDLVHAAVAIEDRRFYKHDGVDWIRTGKAVLSMLTGGRIQGGSTITQQLIKNMTEYDDVTVKRKIIEIFRALEFDKKYSKDDTMMWYLNYIYFGRRCYGVATASAKYFGKDVSELSLAECASLISITNNPSMYDPYTHPENNKNRQLLVLNAMYKEGYITQDEMETAKAEELHFQSGTANGGDSTVYSWYTEQVITDVTADLIETYGYSERVAEDIVYSGGLDIYACVDPNVQAAVDRIYSDTANLPYTSPSGQQLQSAIVIVDQQGNVSGLAGKMGTKGPEDTRGWNRATRSLRQPGSSIKPLAVYAPALEMDLITPYSVIEDSPTMLLDGKPWPSNVDHRYRGMTTVDNAVTLSNNAVAVRVLQMVTPEASFEFLTDRFGISEDHLVRERVSNNHVYSDIGYSQLALGGLTDGVSTLDMASAYSVFPRNGIYVEPRTYSRVVAKRADGEEKILLSRELEGTPVLKEDTVYYTNMMLKNVTKQGSASAATFGGMTVAGKTGSTNSNNDRWFVGYTPYYTAAVWVGYDTPERVKAPGNPAAGLFGKVMKQVHDGLPNKDFPKPDNLVPVSYCLDSGLLATDLCRNDVRGSRAATGYLLPEDVPTESCTMHVEAEICTGAPLLRDDETPTGQYYLAGEFCPPIVVAEDGTETPGRKTVSVLDIAREYVGNVAPEDDIFLLTRMQELGPCAIHTEDGVIPGEPYDPGKFDITNPSTWPTAAEDPLFDPGNPDTWPNFSGELPDPNATVSPDPEGTHTPVQPVVTPAPVPSAEPVPTPIPTAAPLPDGGDEPLLPPDI